MAPAAVLRLPAARQHSFVYVDVGAREAEFPPPIRAAFPLARLVGLEPDPAECARLAGPDRAFYPVVAARRRERRTLYLTANPACCSLLPPDTEFAARFADSLGEPMRPVGTAEVEAVALDEYLASIGVGHVDYLKLDVQGAELEVLGGADRFLRSTVLDLRIEVEFRSLYRGACSFADVLGLLERLGLVLMDLGRARARRRVLPRERHTRGQLVFGQWYLRDHVPLAERGDGDGLAVLAALASAGGFHDYAVEVADALAALQAGEARVETERAVAEYVRSLPPDPGGGSPLWSD